MCIRADFTRPHKTKKAIIAYKCVSTNSLGSTFQSLFAPGARTQQHQFKTFGDTRTYVVGRKYSSKFSHSPGLGCFKELAVARSYIRNCIRDRTILKVRIPAGTKVVRGTTTAYVEGLPCINCERLVVLAVA